MGSTRSGWPLLGLLAGLALLLAACGGARDQEAAPAPELALPSGRALVLVYTDN